MLARFLDVAMELAHFQIIQEDGTFWGEIPGFQGVWARHQTLAGCQRELREALSDWLALRLKLGLEIPELAQMNLNQIGVVSNG
jgi:predicted RNase H-like HicB family nuclease